jgi:hypothetical protein
MLAFVPVGEQSWIATLVRATTPRRRDVTLECYTSVAEAKASIGRRLVWLDKGVNRAEFFVNLRGVETTIVTHLVV